MESQFSKAYPNIAHWVNALGRIEIGPDEYSSSLVRALDEGGLVWESSDDNRNAVKVIDQRGNEVMKVLVLEKGGVV